VVHVIVSWSVRKDETEKANVTDLIWLPLTLMLSSDWAGWPFSMSLTFLR
jgi:hypothetical protein